MLLCSFNVNGLKASVNKGLVKIILDQKPDIICFQETKCQSQILKIDGYYSYWNYCNKKSYSGTATFTKIKPISCKLGFNDYDFNTEGRIITLEYESFYLVNIYVPNSRAGLNRIDYRMQWDEQFYNHIMELEKIKPVIICGDFNVALYKNDRNNIEKKIFINNELVVFNDLLASGFIDAFKYLYSDEDAVTWYRIGKNKKNTGIGYRLDYFLVSSYLKDKINDSKICSNINISDHFPITLKINIGD